MVRTDRGGAAKAKSGATAIASLVSLAALAAACAGAGGEEGRMPSVTEPPATREARPHESDTTLHVVLRVTEKGAATVVAVTELDGRAPQSDSAIGDYLVEVTDRGRVVALQAIPDPFAMHGFGGPPGMPHHESRAGEATVTTKIPGFGRSSDLAGLEIRLSRFRTGGEAVPRLDVETVAALRAEGKLEAVAVVAGAALRSKLDRP